jgi:hypothetical protein
VATATGDPPDAVADAFSRVSRLVLGVTGLAVEALWALLERSVPADRVAVGAGRPLKLPRSLSLLPGAAIGLGLEAQRRSLHATAALRARLRPVWVIAVRPAAHGPLAAVWRRLDLDGWGARGIAEQRRNQLAAAAFLRELVGELAAAVLEQVDVDAIVARVDIDAILQRVDLASVTEQVIDEADVGRIIRESSRTTASETVDALRVQGMRADRALGRIVDWALRRASDRQTSLGRSPDDEPTGGIEG